jgi:nucleotide-binding universal stress UspA family protein
MTELLLVGTDGSETAAVAVAEAADLAARLGAGLLIVTAYPDALTTRLGTQAHNMPAPRDWRTDHRSEAEERLARALGSLGRTDLAVETIARPGDPAEVIIGLAEQRGADLVVVGSKGMTGVGRFLLGSVPSKVSQHAPCSVLIVRTT